MLSHSRKESKRKFSVFPLFTWITVASCIVLSSSCIPEGFDEARLGKFLDRKEAVYEDISVEMGTAVWNLYTDEGPSDQTVPKRRYHELMSGDSLNLIVATWHDKLDGIKDRNLARRVEIWHNILTGARINLAEDVTTLQTDIETWLTEEDTTMVRPSAEELDSSALRLMRLRNEKSREIGFDDYPDMLFEITELGTDWFTSFVETIDSVTLDPYWQLLARIRREKGKDELDYQDVRELIVDYYTNSQSPPIERDRYESLMKETVRNIGIEYDNLPVRYEERQMPSMIGGQGFAIHIPDDFRVVVSPDLPFGDRMHELGHGLQWMFTRSPFPIFKGYEWCFGSEFPGFSEGMAETIAGFTKNREWQKRYTGSTEEEMDAMAAVVKDCAPAYIRYQLVTFMFEIALYEDLARAPDQVYEEIFEKYLLVDRPTDRPIIPLANMAYVSYPIYLQNYFLADIIAWQMHQAMESKFGEMYAFDEGVIGFLDEHIYRNGELVPWRTRLQNATGSDLDVIGYLGSLGM